MPQYSLVQSHRFRPSMAATAYGSHVVPFSSAGVLKTLRGWCLSLGARPPCWLISNACHPPEGRGSSYATLPPWIPSWALSKARKCVRNMPLYVHTQLSNGTHNGWITMKKCCSLFTAYWAKPSNLTEKAGQCEAGRAPKTKKNSLSQKFFKHLAAIQKKGNARNVLCCVFEKKVGYFVHLIPLLSF